jgi:hypothetical protein
MNISVCVLGWHDRLLAELFFEVSGNLDESSVFPAVPTTETCARHLRCCVLSMVMIKARF